MISQEQFQQEVDNRASRGGTVATGNLETWGGISDQLISEAGDADVVPDGGEWKGSDGRGTGIFQFAPNVRATVRNYCMWLEFTLPGGQTGINVSAHGPNADRFARPSA